MKFITSFACTKMKFNEHFQKKIQVNAVCVTIGITCGVQNATFHQHRNFKLIALLVTQSLDHHYTMLTLGHPRLTQLRQKLILSRYFASFPVNSLISFPTFIRYKFAINALSSLVKTISEAFR